ncbi:MAG: hypothetical protein M1536_06735 [Firmicutes bacterium]|nr:hypothetical protein [Bacillota bacterium]
MKITSSEEFRNENQILFSAKVIHENYGFLRSNPFGGRDIIDLNNNGKADRGMIINDYPDGTTPYIKEPALAQSYDDIKNLGLNNKTEVLTQDDIKKESLTDIQVENLVQGDGLPIFLSSGEPTGFCRDVIENDKRSISSLIDEVGVKAINPKWGFDLTKDEFLIYEPKK